MKINILIVSLLALLGCQPDNYINLEITDVTSSTVSLNWNSVNEANSYEVHQANESFDATEELNYGVLQDYKSYYTISTYAKAVNLSKRTKYYFIVTAFNDNKRVAISNVVIGFPDLKRPPKPTSLTMTVTDNDSISLNWNKVEGVKIYTLYTATSSFTDSYQNTLEYKSISLNKTSIIIPNIDSNNTYYFAVTAFKDGRHSLISNQVTK